MTLGAASFCVAGAALGAPPARFAWQAQHLEHLSSFCVAGATLGAAPPAGFAWQAQHLDLCLVLRCSCSTWSTKVSFCMAGAALDASQLGIAGHFSQAQTIHTIPSTLHHQTHHHQDNTLSTTSSTQSHQHNLTNASPSTQHHLHNIINIIGPDNSTC